MGRVGFSGRSSLLSWLSFDAFFLAFVFLTGGFLRSRPPLRPRQESEGLDRGNEKSGGNSSTEDCANSGGSESGELSRVEVR